jgi:hypothetical protein
MGIKRLKTRFKKVVVVLAVVITCLSVSAAPSTSTTGQVTGGTNYGFEKIRIGEVVAGTVFGMDFVTPPPPPVD